MQEVNAVTEPHADQQVKITNPAICGQLAVEGRVVHYVSAPPTTIK